MHTSVRTMREVVTLVFRKGGYLERADQVIIVSQMASRGIPEGLPLPKPLNPTTSLTKPLIKKKGLVRLIIRFTSVESEKTEV
jgi:hypothetical protein